MMKLKDIVLVHNKWRSDVDKVAKVKAAKRQIQKWKREKTKAGKTGNKVKTD
jgi:hypothetical protein